MGFVVDVSPTIVCLAVLERRAFVADAAHQRVAIDLIVLHGEFYFYRIKEA